MKQVEYRFNPQGAVLEAYYLDRSRMSFIMGPLGRGKTTQTCQKILKLMVEQEPNANNIRPSRWVSIRNTYGDLLSTTAKDWLEMAGDLGDFKQGSKEPPHQAIHFHLPDGTLVQAEMIFLALDRDDHVKKLRGYQVTGFWLNEVKELPKAIVDMADLRHGRYPSLASAGVKPTWHGMLGDTNAPDDDSWYFNLAEDVKPKGWSFFRQPGGVIAVGKDENNNSVYEVNPGAENMSNLPNGYYSHGMQGKKLDWIKVNLANEYGFVVDGKPVYPEYSDSLHCRSIAPVKGVNLRRGWDFGLTPACTISQALPSGHWHVLDEIITDDDVSGIERFSERVLQYCSQAYPDFKFDDFGDPAGDARSQTDERTCFSIMRGKGIVIRAGEQEPLLRQESVRKALSTIIDGRPCFAINQKCKVLRKGFAGGYHFRKLRVSEERYAEAPEKNLYSHIHDALQYDATRLFGGVVKGREANKLDYRKLYG